MQMILMSAIVGSADQLADRLTVDVGQHHVEDDQVGVVLLGQHPGAEAVVDVLGLEPGSR